MIRKLTLITGTALLVGIVTAGPASAGVKWQGSGTDGVKFGVPSGNTWTGTHR